MKSNLYKLINKILAQTEGALIASGANEEDVIDFVNQSYNNFDEFISQNLPGIYAENHEDFDDEE